MYKKLILILATALWALPTLSSEASGADYYEEPRFLDETVQAQVTYSESGKLTLPQSIILEARRPFLPFIRTLLFYDDDRNEKQGALLFEGEGAQMSFGLRIANSTLSRPIHFRVIEALSPTEVRGIEQERGELSPRPYIRTSSLVFTENSIKQSEVTIYTIANDGSRPVFGDAELGDPTELGIYDSLIPKERDFVRRLQSTEIYQMKKEITRSLINSGSQIFISESEFYSYRLNDSEGWRSLPNSIENRYSSKFEENKVFVVASSEELSFEHIQDIASEAAHQATQAAHESSPEGTSRQSPSQEPQITVQASGYIGESGRLIPKSQQVPENLPSNVVSLEEFRKKKCVEALGGKGSS